MKVRTPGGRGAGPHPVRGRGRRLCEHGLEDGAAAAPDAGRRGRGEDAGQPVVGRDDAGAGVRTEDPLVAVGGDAGPVAVDDGAGAGARAQHRGADVAGDGRVQPVGPDHERRVDGQRPAGVVATVDARDPAPAIGAQADDGDAVADLGPGLRCRVDEQRVEDRPPRRVQRVDAVRGADRDDHLLVVVAERRAADGGGAGLDEAVEQPPAVELEDAAPHERVRRERVGAVAAAVDDEDAQAGAGQQHRRRRAGGAGADDDDVVVGSVGVHRSAPFRCRRSRAGSGIAGVRPVRWSAMSTASRPTPSMKLELRRCWKRWPRTYRPGTGVTPRRWRISPAASRTGSASHG